MIRLFVRHEVADFDAWKKGYDAFDAERRRLGVRADAVFRGAVVPGDVTVWHDFDSLAAARAFVATPQLAEVMRAAGVVGTPQVWFVDRELRT